MPSVHGPRGGGASPAVAAYQVRRSSQGNERVSRPRSERRTQPRLSPQRRGGRDLADRPDTLEQGGDPTLEDLIRAREIRDWVSQLRQRCDDGFQAKLAACLERDRLTSRELPLAASAVRAYNRQLYWQIRRERANRRPA